MARKYLIGGNWKCNGTTESVPALVSAAVFLLCLFLSFRFESSHFDLELGDSKCCSLTLPRSQALPTVEPTSAVINLLGVVVFFQHFLGITVFLPS